MDIKVGKKIISKNVPIASTLSQHIIGLMGFKEGELLMDFKEEKIIPIHTWFCKPMNITYIDANGIVVDFVKMDAWQEHYPKKKHRYVFETTNVSKTFEIGEKISFLK